MLAARYDEIAEEMFRSWGIPKTYLVFRNNEDLAELMENELIAPEDAGFMDCACDCSCCEEEADTGNCDATDEDDEFTDMVASLATALHSIFGNNVAVHIIVE